MWDLIVSVPDHCLSFYFTRRCFHDGYVLGPTPIFVWTSENVSSIFWVVLMILCFSYIKIKHKKNIYICLPADPKKY